LPLQYLSSVSSSLLIFLLGMTYSTIAPLILPFVFIYFVYGYFVYKYNLVFVRAPRFESGGLFFPLVFARLCVVCSKHPIKISRSPNHALTDTLARENILSCAQAG
jgi:hypothetical protein